VEGRSRVGTPSESQGVRRGDRGGVRCNGPWRSNAPGAGGYEGDHHDDEHHHDQHIHNDDEHDVHNHPANDHQSGAIHRPAHRSFGTASAYNPNSYHPSAYEPSAYGATDSHWRHPRRLLFAWRGPWRDFYRKADGLYDDIDG
jgi:hypothetical protein